MHILTAIDREKRFFLPFLALLLLGLSLSYVTWLNLRQQRLAVERHMVLAARAVALGMESNMGWRMRGSSRMDRPTTREFFQELLASPDLVFVGVIGPNGRMIISSDESGTFPGIPQEGLEWLRGQRQWHEFTRYNDRNILLYVHQIRPLVARHFHDPGPSRHNTGPGQAAFLVLGLDMSEHMGMYQDARRAAIWQTGYVLGTVVLLWIGGMTLLQRREQAGRVRELERFQAKLLDNLPDGLLTLDESGVVRGANPSALALLGGDDLLGRRWDELPLNQSLNPAFGQRSMKNGSDEYGGQYAYADRHLEILAVPLNRDGRDAGERLVLIRDRTAIKKLEESLQEAERLAAIGRLAASVAHEIRNPLSALRGFAQYFAQKLVGREPEQSYADTMVSEADRLNGVITDLLFLAKPRQPCKKRVNLLALIEDVRTLIKTDLERHGVEMKAVPAAEPFADVDLLKQCLLNLAMNALQAAPSRDGWLVVGSETGENGTVVYVADNGTGMNAQQRRRALEPFFTTRKDGSGLGLAIVHRIVRDHGGSLDIVSEPDGGTRVSLFFPDSP